MRLSSGFAGTTAGPVSPPLIIASRLSSLRLRDCFRGPWHFTQRSTRIGRTRDSKNSTASGDGDAPAGFLLIGPSARPHAQLDAINTPTRRNRQARPIRNPLPDRSGRSRSMPRSFIILPGLGVVRSTAGELGWERQRVGSGVLKRETPEGDRPSRATVSRSVGGQKVPPLSPAPADVGNPLGSCRSAPIPIFHNRPSGLVPRPAGTGYGSLKEVRFTRVVALVCTK